MTRKLTSMVDRKAPAGRFEQSTVWSEHTQRCSHTYDGERCPFPGNVHDGRWLCLYHIDPGNRANDAEQARFYQRFNPHDSHGRACISDMLEEWYPKAIERGIRAAMVDNPIWFRGDGETRSEYNRRMFAIARPLQRGAVVRTKEAGGAA